MVVSNFSFGLVADRPLRESTTRVAGELRKCLSDPSMVVTNVERLAREIVKII